MRSRGALHRRRFRRSGFYSAIVTRRKGENCCHAPDDCRFIGRAFRGAGRGRAEHAAPRALMLLDEESRATQRAFFIGPPLLIASKDYAGLSCRYFTLHSLTRRRCIRHRRGYAT